jgi:peptidoglycan/xylan/chitin deacetylase (PgdA/CDA1 family)
MMKTTIKSLLKYCIGFFYRINPFFRLTLKEGLTVFVFHEVSDNPSEFTKRFGLALGVNQFKSHAEWINKNFNVINPELLIGNHPLPSNAALITFDDGFAGAFNNAFPILDDLNMPSVMFMNMQPQIKHTPMLSALVIYLSHNSSTFKNFINKFNFEKPAYLSVTPNIMHNFKFTNEMTEYSQIMEFQGDLVDTETMEFWDNCPNIYYGNHLYDHWNAAALTEHDLEQQYILNKMALDKFKSSIDMFAFTNGKPETCFSQRDINILEKLGAIKIFSSVQGVNEVSDSILLGRTFIGDLDTTENHLWCKVGLSHSKIT